MEGVQAVQQRLVEFERLGPKMRIKHGVQELLYVYIYNKYLHINSHILSITCLCEFICI